MSKQKKKGLVPALRFPEFRDKGEWEKKSINQIAELYKGKGISKADIVADGKQPCIRYGELYTSYGEVIDEVISKTNLSSSDLFFSEKNDVIIPSSGETKIDIATAACVLHDNIALGGDLNVIRTNQNGVFLSYCFNGALKNKISKIAQGDTVVHLYATQLKQIDVAIPSGKEQQKIADCLSSIDELVTFQTRKLDGLKAHKKGLMQQLFPAEGETLPKLRFPEFRDKGDWKIKRLEDFAIIVRGGSPRPIDEYLSNEANGLNWLKIGDIDKESKFVTNTQEKVIPSALAKTRVVNPGDLILSNSMSFGRPYILEIKTCIHDGWIAVSEIDKSLDRDFLYYLMMTSASQTYFTNNAAGSGVQNLNADIIKLLPVSLPSKKEQQKIADCLASIDELITAQTQKIDDLKAHKKGLMQQLFPTMDDDCMDARGRATQDVKAEVGA